MKISTTIKKAFFEMKMADLKENGFFVEYKDVKPYWTKRLEKIPVDIMDKPTEETEIVFLVGKVPHRFRVIEINYSGLIPTKYREAITTGYAYAIKCVPLEVRAHG